VGPAPTPRRRHPHEDGCRSPSGRAPTPAGGTPLRSQPNEGRSVSKGTARRRGSSSRTSAGPEIAHDEALVYVQATGVARGDWHVKPACRTRSASRGAGCGRPRPRARLGPGRGRAGRRHGRHQAPGQFQAGDVDVTLESAAPRPSRRPALKETRPARRHDHRTSTVAHHSTRGERHDPHRPDHNNGTCYSRRMGPFESTLGRGMTVPDGTGVASVRALSLFRLQAHSGPAGSTQGSQREGGSS
jgi:hypothetical protein